MIQYRESPDGGTRHVHGSCDKLLKDWTLHDGLIPGPDMVKAEIDAQVREEIWASIESQPVWVARRIEIEAEVNAKQREL